MSFPETPHISENHGENESVRTQFLKPFDQTEVVGKFNEPYQNPEAPSWSTVYWRDFANNLSYVVSKKNADQKSGEALAFQLLSQGEDTKETPILGSLVYEPGAEEGFSVADGKKYWNMRHRVVGTKDLGITGTDFLTQSEAYLSVLKKNKLIEADTLTAGVSQPSALKWLQKNGFTFNAANRENPHDYFYILENGTFEPKPPYKLMKVQGDYLVKDEYLVNENFIHDPYFEEKWKDAVVTQDGEMMLKVSGDAGNRRSHGMTDLLKEMSDKGYIPRFLLEKNL